jgi:hypothetical protein
MLSRVFSDIFPSLEFTERRGRVVSTPASYFGGLGFKTWPGDRLP